MPTVAILSALKDVIGVRALAADRASHAPDAHRSQHACTSRVTSRASAHPQLSLQRCRLVGAKEDKLPPPLLGPISAPTSPMHLPSACTSSRSTWCASYTHAHKHAYPYTCLEWASASTTVGPANIWATVVGRFAGTARRLRRQWGVTFEASNVARARDKGG